MTVTSRAHCVSLPPCPIPFCQAVYRGLCGSDCGAPLSEFGSVRGLESRPTLSPIQRPWSALRLGSFSQPYTTQWPPQRRLQAPAHSCRYAGAAQVRGRVEDGVCYKGVTRQRCDENGTVLGPTQNQLLVGNRAQKADNKHLQVVNFTGMGCSILRGLIVD